MAHKSSAYLPGRHSAVPNFGETLCTPIDTVDGLDVRNVPYVGEAHEAQGTVSDDPK